MNQPNPTDQLALARSLLEEALPLVVDEEYARSKSDGDEVTFLRLIGCETLAEYREAKADWLNSNTPLSERIGAFLSDTEERHV